LGAMRSLFGTVNPPFIHRAAYSVTARGQPQPGVDAAPVRPARSGATLPQWRRAGKVT
jgi:hypothetical protein